MKLLRKEVATGLLHLGLDTIDDLWTLRNLIQPGDRVTADTVRTADVGAAAGAGGSVGGEGSRAGKAEKRRMRLGVRVESVEFHDFADRLRVLGPIETGPQDHGRFHTIALGGEPGEDVIVEKRRGLLPHHLALVEEAVAATQRPQILLLAIDDAEAQFAYLKPHGLQVLGSLPAGGQGKRGGAADAAAAKRQFFDEVVKSVRALRPDPAVPLVVVGPGWWREEFVDHLQRDPAQASGVLTEGTSQGGRGGLSEALRRGIAARVQKDHRVGEDTRLVEEIFTRIGGDGLVAYGPADVAGAVDAGAAETVLVSDVAVREGRFDATLDTAGRVRAHVRIVATGHEAGARLEQMGGIAALLRFKP